MKKFRTDSSRSIGPLLAIETVNSELFGNKSTEASVVCKGKELDAEILGCTTMRIFSSPNEDYSSMLPVWTNAQLVPSWKRIYQVFSGLGRLGSLSPSSAAAHSGFKFHKLQVLLRGQLRCVVPNWRGSAEWVRKLKRSQGLRGGHVHDMYTTCTRHVHTARSIFRKTIDSKTDGKNLRKFTAKKSSKQDIPVHVAFQRCFCQRFLEAGLAQSSSC